MIPGAILMNAPTAGSFGLATTRSTLATMLTAALLGLIECLQGPENAEALGVCSASRVYRLIARTLLRKAQFE